MLTAQHGPLFSEIKIAIIGYVSVGKTTVLNALFRDRYSHVYMTPTTAAVNNFRISSKPSRQEEKRKADTMNEDDDMMEDVTPRTAESTLKEITADNAELRNADTVQEKTFEIELQQDLCKMRPDTKLVLVDIPGINEAGASHKYRDYVTDHWHTFDCVICVLDATLGVNTEEQMDLLKLFKENTTKIKDMPVIFLCNKVDEPEYEEPQVLVRAARQAVEKIFNVGCREKALETILKKVTHDDSHHHANGNLFPVFIPISALRAFIYQAASLMSRDEFHTMDKDHILKLGKENVAGKKWRKLSAKEKLDMAFEVVSDPEQCREGLATSNFDKFLQVLSYSVGGETTQQFIMEKQIDVATARLSSNVCLAHELQIIIDRSKALGKLTGHLKQTFWNLFNSCETQAFEEFQRPEEVSELAAAMKQLTAYYDLVKDAGWHGEETLIKDAMKKLIRRQFGVLFDNVPLCVGTSTTASTIIAWESLPLQGWENIFCSILMVANERACYEHFGQEIVWLQSCLCLTRKHIGEVVAPVSSSTRVCPVCRGNYVTLTQDVLYCEDCDKFFNTKGNKGQCGCCMYTNNLTIQLTMGRPNESCTQCGYMTQDYQTLQDYLKIKSVDGRWEPADQAAYKRNVGVDIPADGPSDSAHYGHLMWHFYRFMKAVDKD